jgi:Tfp pilus assembly protein PilE
MIEMMLTVAIVAVLAVIALGSDAKYRERTQMLQEPPPEASRVARSDFASS